MSQDRMVTNIPIISETRTTIPTLGHFSHKKTNVTILLIIMLTLEIQYLSSLLHYKGSFGIYIDLGGHF